MANATTMTYGDYSFTPVPLVNYQRSDIQVGSRENPVGYNFTMTLTGTLTPYPSDGGLITIDDLIEELREAFNRSGKRLQIKCGAAEIMTIYPQVISLDFQQSNNNWVNTVPYTIELAFASDELHEHPDGELPYYIEEFNEEWSVEFVQDKHHFVWDLSMVVDQKGGYDYTTYDANNKFEARVTHTVSAKGRQTWAGTGVTGTMTSATENALGWLLNTFNDFDYNATEYGHSLSGWTNLVGVTGLGGYSVGDHFRTHVINETQGNVSFTQSWTVLGTNSGVPDHHYFSEDVTIEVREGIDNGLVNISINGTIQGLQDLDYSTPNATTNVVNSSYSRATGAWSVIQDRIFPRAQLIYEQEFSRTLNPSPVSKSIGHNPNKGNITYAYEFNDRPCSFITGSLSENFTITDNNPTDVFARLTVLGRAAGPVLQEISTVTEATREVVIEAVMPLPTGCSSITDLDLYNPSTNVKNLLCEFETQLTSSYDQVFKNSDSENWNPLTGRYSRTVGWTYASCASGISTSMCS